jgi:benzoyl-CoA reductase/2-hydroxyglutaryl-CoA dehydratase subunit BcrC/BadD/HgdB
MTGETTQTGSKIRGIVRACSVITRMNQARPDARHSEVLYYRMLNDYFTRILNARQNGDFVAAHTVFFPAELLYSMGLVPMHCETTTWMTSLFTGDCADILAAGAEVGLASEICAAHRGLAGAFALGSLPTPDAVLWTNLICDNTAKSGELIVELTGAPGFFLDHPFSDSPEEKQYLVSELGDMISFLEEHSGRKMDWDKLSEAVAVMDRQIALTREINELRKSVPTPFHWQGFLELLTVDYMFPGQPAGIEYLETLKQELTEMVAAGKGAVPDERFRLMTLFVPPTYQIGFLEKLSQEFGAVTVVEPYFTYWGEGRLDPERPLESVAQKSYMIPEARMYGPLDDRALKLLTDLAEQYRVDGAVYFADVGCRHTCATVKLFKDLLGEMDIPTLTIDSDVVDPTILSKEDLREKLERFFELLEDR